MSVPAAGQPGLADGDLASEQTARLDEASLPSLNFPADNNARFGPLLAFGGLIVDGIDYAATSIAA